MQHRDASRSWNRNGRRLMRDRLGRLMGSTRMVLADSQILAVKRLFRMGKSLDEIADAIGVSRNTLQRRLADQLAHLPRRRKSWMDVSRRDDPSPEELLQEMAKLRRP